MSLWPRALADNARRALPSAVEPHWPDTIQACSCAAFMNLRPILSFALALCLAGCSSLTTSQLHCASLSHEEQELVYSDLNRSLVSKGLSRSSHEDPYAMGEWFAPLRKGSADFSVSAHTNRFGMDIYINNFHHSMSASANKALMEEIVQCVKSNAPSALVNMQVTRDVFPAWSPWE